MSSLLLALLCISLCVLPVLAVVNPMNRFCRVKCGDHTQIICELEPTKCKISWEKCGKAVGMPLNDKENKYIEHEFNKLRNEAAAGRLPGSVLGNFRALWFTHDIDFAAQCIAHQCGKVDGLCLKHIDGEEFGVSKAIIPVKDESREALLKKAVAVIIQDAKALTASDYSDKLTPAKIKNGMAIISDRADSFGCGRSYYEENSQHMMMLWCCVILAPKVGEPLVKKIRKEDVCECGCDSKPDYPNLCHIARKYWSGPLLLYKPPYEMDYNHGPNITNYKASNAHHVSTNWCIISFALLMLLIFVRTL